MMMTDPRRQRWIAGGALIVLGLGLWGLQRFGNIGPSAFYFLVGGSFLAAYLARREFGFLIPACILLGLGAGSVGHGFSHWGDSSFLGLGFGFVAIFLIALVYERKSHWWPLVPGAVLIALGLPNTGAILRFVYLNWPLILVAVGVLILFGAFGRGDRRGGAA